MFVGAIKTVLSTTNILTDLIETESQKFYTWNDLKEYLVGQLPTVFDFLLNLIVAVIVLLVGIRIIKFARKLVKKAIAKTPLDEGLKQFIDNIFNLFLYFVLIMIILANFGITASSVIAIVGSVGLSIGLALQGTLSNFAGGVLILLLKPFKVGDYILEDTHGNEGTVSEIQLFYTKLVTVDNRTVVLPNGTLSNCSLTNYTTQKKRMVDLTTGISYHADLKKAKDVITNVVMAEPARLPEEKVMVFVAELGESSVNIGMRVWVKTEDYFAAKWRLTENIKLALDENQIEIPYPHMNVIINNENETK